MSISVTTNDDGLITVVDLNPGPVSFIELQQGPQGIPGPPGNGGDLTGAVTSIGDVTSLGSFTLTELNTALSDADVASGGGVATGTNSQDIPILPNVLYVNPSYVGDPTAVIGAQENPYQYFQSAYAAAAPRDTIIGIKGRLSDPAVTSLLIDKVIFLDGGMYQNSGVSIIDCALTVHIDNTDNLNVVFKGLNIYSSTLDQVPMTITKVCSHSMILQDIYFYRSDVTKIALQTSGTWEKKAGSTTPPILWLRDVSFQGIFVHGAGTPGNPFDELGICIVESCDKQVPGTRSTIRVDSGYMYIEGPTAPYLVLNGGVLDVNNYHHSGVDVGGYHIVANNVAAVGDSFLFIRSYSQGGLFYNPTVVAPKIFIGANQVYHIDADLIDMASIVIDPTAVKYSDYLVSIGRNPMVAYNTAEYYRAISASTADKLTTARTINGVSFDGSGNITVPAAGSTLTDTVPVGKGGIGLTAVGTALQILRTNADANAIEWAAEQSTFTYSLPVPLLVPSLVTGATYTQTGTTITVTATGNALLANHNGASCFLIIATGLAVTGWFTNFTYVDGNTFTVTSSVSQSTSGNLTVNTSISNTVATATIQGSTMGKNGGLFIDCESSGANKAKIITSQYGASTIFTLTVATTQTYWFNRYIKNINATNRQCMVPISIAAPSNGAAAVFLTKNSTASQDVTFLVTHNNQSDFIYLYKLNIFTDYKND